MKHQPNDSLGYLVDNISRYLRIGLHRKFIINKQEVTAEQWKILVRLWITDGQTHRELSLNMDKDQTSTTRLIHGLEKRNLVVRTPDQNDRRIKRVYLTHKGRESEEKLTLLAQKMLKEAWKEVSMEEKETCKNVLRKLLLNLRIE